MPFLEDATATVHHGDCLDVLAAMPAGSVDAVVTDPPYGLGFMGKEWDSLPPGEEWARACLRVLKPGGHLLAFGGTRTWHRLTVAVEDAGFEIRDSIAWLYGSGFPKSLDVSKAIDKAAGASPIDLGVSPNWRESKRDREKDGRMEVRGAGAGRLTAPATDTARQWSGWGTALKPAFEPIVVARKPLAGTVAANVQAHGVGALNIDGCRIGTDSIEIHKRTENVTAASSMSGTSTGSTGTGEFRVGRWPANVILDESQAAALDEQSGIMRDGVAVNRNRDNSQLASDSGWGFRKQTADVGHGGSGGASRFFYCAKAPKRERPTVDGVSHPTVKPLTLMRYLIRLVTPPGGTVLDPFAGSGATLEAALLERARPIGIERAAEYLPLIMERITRAQVQQADVDEPLTLFDENGVTAPPRYPAARHAPCLANMSATACCAALEISVAIRSTPALGGQ